MRKYSKRHIYTDQEIQFLKDNAPKNTLKSITEKFNKYFGININSGSIFGTLKRRKIEFIKIDKHFKTGRIPWNKGKKLPGFIPTNGFKNGNHPPTYKKIGTEIVNKSGYIEIKIADPNVWKLKHHLIYENYHHVEIGEFNKIVFLDGNKRNFDIGNLALLSNSEQVAYMKFQNKNRGNPDIQKMYVSIAKMNSKIRNLLKKG